MTTTKTQGLLLAEQYRLVTKDGAIPVAEASMHSTLAESTDQMRRLAACWNALDGLPTEHLESFMGAAMAKGGFIGLWSNYCDQKTEVADLKEQRAELLTALQAMDEAMCNAGNPHMSKEERAQGRQAIISARAAIARVQGGAA